jgi:uncharacterized membrane protein YtjA (UPF0391 family)
MLHYWIVFFVVALFAGLFGFTGVAGAAADIARILFVLVSGLAVLSYVINRIEE